MTGEHGRGARDRCERGDERDAAEGRDDAEDRGEQRHPGREQRAERDEQHHAGEQHAERLGDRQAERGLLEHLAAERDLESGVAAGFARCEHGLDRLVGDLRDGSVELDLDVRGALVAGDLVARVLVERAEHARDAVDVLELGLHRLDRVAVGRLLDGRAVGRLDHGLGRGAGRLREHRGELVDRVLRLGAGDGVGLLELPAEADAEAEQGAERDRPGDDDEPGAAEGDASDAVEEEGHGFSLGERWWGRAAVGAGEGRSARGARG